MKITYNILWVEDEDSWFETTNELFTDSLEDLGFVMQTKRCKNISDVQEEVENNRLKDYDLLLVDFTLKNSDSGDLVIDFIRNFDNHPILTDVLFYSSAVENVRDSMHRLGLEGVYTADRRDLETKFELVVNTTIKKIQEVNNMRGLIMAETSDLDELMLEIISNVLNTDISEDMSKYIDNEIKSTIGFLSALSESESKIAEKIHDSRLYTSFHKAKTINKLHKLSGIGIEKYFESYNIDVLTPRNIFAHVKESELGGEKVLVSEKTGKKEVFTEERCIEIRKHLIRYRATLESILEELL